MPKPKGKLREKFVNRTKNIGINIWDNRKSRLITLWGKNKDNFFSMTLNSVQVYHIKRLMEAFLKWEKENPFERT